MLTEKYGVLHSPLLLGFRPRNLQVEKNLYPTKQSPIYSTIQSQASIVLKRASNVFHEYMHSVFICPYPNAKSGGLLI